MMTKIVLSATKQSDEFKDVACLRGHGITAKPLKIPISAPEQLNTGIVPAWLVRAPFR